MRGIRRVLIWKLDAHGNNFLDFDRISICLTCSQTDEAFSAPVTWTLITGKSTCSRGLRRRLWLLNPMQRWNRLRLLFFQQYLLHGRGLTVRKRVIRLHHLGHHGPFNPGIVELIRWSVNENSKAMGSDPPTASQLARLAILTWSWFLSWK